MDFGFPVLVVFRALAPWIRQLAASVLWLLGFPGWLLVFRAGWHFCVFWRLGSMRASLVPWLPLRVPGWAVSREVRGAFPWFEMLGFLWEIIEVAVCIPLSCL